MQEPKKIKLSPETPCSKEPTKHRLAPLDIPEYSPTDLDKINKILDEIYEDNSKDN